MNATADTPSRNDHKQMVFKLAVIVAARDDRGRGR